ncbi:hypothetical protein [Terrisporobacter vanillatitrophus]|uniref:hypothetical protein n=1 Tax=Terrisporobacter vanillatitrophus TaxID=3058402 RepID=UPI003EBCD8F6
MKQKFVDRHGSSSTYKNKPSFNENFDIKSGINSTLKGRNSVVKSNTGGRTESMDCHVEELD